MPDRKPRRTAVKNHPGIYWREGKSGRRYEISFTDSEGRRRWKVVEGNLEDAKAAREDLRGRIRKGERVVPTRLTVAEVAQTWLAAQANLRPRTRERYELALRVHVLPRVGRVRVSSLTVDDVAWLIGEMQKAGLAGWTVRGHLTPLSRVMAYAVRNGMAGANPVKLLNKGERPPVESSRKQVLAEAARARGRTRRPEDGGVTAGCPVLPALARVLPEANVASSYSGPGDFVFASETGTPLQARHVARRGVAKAVANAGLNPDGKRRIGWHLLRHGFGSMLLAQGENVVFVSGQLGHKDPRITLGIYAHEFNQDAQLEHGARPARRSAWNIVGNRPWRRAASGGDGERCRCRTVAADRRLAATHREPCSGLTSRGSLVRARHRPTRKGLETGPLLPAMAVRALASGCWNTFLERRAPGGA